MASSTSVKLLLVFMVLTAHYAHARHLLHKTPEELGGQDKKMVNPNDHQDHDDSNREVAPNVKDNKDAIVQPNQIPIPGIPGLPVPPVIPGIPGLPGGGGIPEIPGLPGGGGGGIPALPIPGITPGVPALPIPGITPGVPALPIPGINPGLPPLPVPEITSGVPALPIPTLPLPPFPFLTPPPMG